VGLGLLNLVVVVLVITLVQLQLLKYIPAAGPAVLAVICLATYIAASRLIERRTPTELAANRALPEGAAGIALGFLLFAVVMAVLLAVGVYHPAGWGTTNGLANGLFFAVMAGITEEILFRGLLFRLSSKIVGTWGALIFTSGLFGLAHKANPGATLASSVAIALEAGVLLGAAYVATQRLWLPIGLHIGWNFTEGPLFGMTLSGNKMTEGVLRGSLSGPGILTGGAFGPEASMVAVVVCVAAALYFLWRVVKLQRAEPAMWDKQRA
jgi:membrane protease YdiL (CAAX protease family)